MVQTHYATQSPERAKRLNCSEIWGGIGNVDSDIAIGPVTASLFSAASEGTSGGDIYYFSVCDDDAIVRIAIADVVGHGDAVSYISRWIYSALATKMNGIEGNSILVELNELANRVGLRAMTTAAVLSFQVDDSTLYLSYAGHPPVWIQRFGDRVWRPHVPERSRTLANVPLGAFPNATYDQTQIQLHAGDRFFVHTDGLTEASNPSGNEFGEDRLRTVLTDGREKSLGDLKNHILAAVRAHTGGTLGHDDVTLMVAEAN